MYVNLPFFWQYYNFNFDVSLVKVMDNTLLSFNYLFMLLIQFDGLYGNMLSAVCLFFFLIAETVWMNSSKCKDFFFVLESGMVNGNKQSAPKLFFVSDKSCGLSGCLKV